MYIFLICYFFYCRPCWVLMAACRLSLVAVSRGYSSLQRADFSLWWLLLLWSTGSRHMGSVVASHGLSCPVACGIFPDQGWNLCPLHCRVDSYHWTTREAPKGIFLLNNYLMPATILDPWDTSVNKMGKSPCRYGSHILNIFDGGWLQSHHPQIGSVICDPNYRQVICVCHDQWQKH